MRLRVAYRLLRVEIAEVEMEDRETQLQRLPHLAKWFVDIESFSSAIRDS